MGAIIAPKGGLWIPVNSRGDTEKGKLVWELGATLLLFMTKFFLGELLVVEEA